MISWLKRIEFFGLPKKILLLLIFLSIFSTLAELVSIGIFLPILEVIQKNGLSSDNLIVSNLSHIFNKFNIDLSLGNLLTASFLLYLSSKLLIFFIGIINAYYTGSLLKINRDKLLNLYLHCNPSYYDKVALAKFINQSFVELPSAISGIFAPIKFLVLLIAGLGSIIFLFLISLEITIINFVVIAVSILIPYRYVKQTTPAGRKNSEYNSKITTFLLNRIKSPRLVRLTGSSQKESLDYSKLTERQRLLTLHIHKLKAKVDLVMEPTIIGATLVILYISIEIFKLEFSMLVIYMLIMLRLVPIVKSLIAQKQIINRCMGPIDTMEDLISRMTSSYEDYKKFDLMPELNEEISEMKLQNVSFSYSQRRKFELKKINISFQKGSINAIVGSSGSGKSTLIDVISGYKRPTNGEIFVNNKSLDNFKIKVSYVPQDIQMLDGTLRSHILYGVEDNYQTLIKAAKLSKCYDFVQNLPEKFDTPIIENGKNFSGGQRQRIDLARALASDSQLIILDEPTANLDSITEREFISTLNEITNETNKIIIIISHRLETIKESSQIIILDKGAIVGVGKHLELLKTNQWYKTSLNN